MSTPAPHMSPPDDWRPELHANAMLPGLGRRHVIYLPPLVVSVLHTCHAVVDVPSGSEWLDENARDFLRGVLLAGSGVWLAYPEGGDGLEEATARLATLRREVAR